MAKVYIRRYSAWVGVVLAAVTYCMVSIALFPDFADQRISAPHDALAADVYRVLNFPIAWTATFWMFMTYVFGTLLGVDPDTNLVWVPPLVMALIQVGGVYLAVRAIRIRRRARQLA